MKTPSVPTVMLAVMGLFQAVAAMGTWIPSFIDDRVVEQFIPVWTLILRPVQGETPSEPLVKTIAYGSQFLIGTSEVAIAVALLGAAFIPRKRLAWTNLGLGLSTGLFGSFMIVMFAVDDKNLPKWHMYLGVLTWIGVTWLLVTLTDGRAESGCPNGGTSHRE